MPKPPQRIWPGSSSLYANANAVRIQIPKDDDKQKEFETLEYNETEAQLRAPREIKEDMEQTFPMDRLLCGDVGFGKTEVALRDHEVCAVE